MGTHLGSGDWVAFLPLASYLLPLTSYASHLLPLASYLLRLSPLTPLTLT